MYVDLTVNGDIHCDGDDFAAWLEGLDRGRDPPHLPQLILSAIRRRNRSESAVHSDNLFGCYLPFSFDHLVSTQQDRGRQLDADRLGGPEIDDHLETLRL